MDFSNCAALVLAAGKGTRMRSKTPKVLQKILGEPMLAYVVNALKPIFGGNIFLVVGYCAEAVKQTFPACNFVEQPEQKGTGDALRKALPHLEKAGAARVLVINGDAPLITDSDILEFWQAAKDFDIACATIILSDPGAYGRIARKNDSLQAIVEAKEYDENIFGPPTGEVNAGLYSLSLDAIKKLAPKLSDNNKSGEFYITDLVALGHEEGLNIGGIPCAREENLIGVNSPSELAIAENMLAASITKNFMDEGVIIHGPAQMRIGPYVKIEPGVELSGPGEIYGPSVIRTGTKIGANCVIRDTVINKNALIHPFCHLEGAHIGQETIVGPFARLRQGADLAEKSHVGNFVELKKTHLGVGSKANHLSYLGDSEIGDNVNIGAGTITCNYNGKNKLKTTIGGNAFIGSNTALVAPVRIGANVLVGAGSVITKDVPENDLAIARAKQANLPRRKK